MAGYLGGTAADDLARLRRMIAEPDITTYPDYVLVTTIAYYPAADAAGYWPYLTSGSANTAWTPTFDLAAAAADIWSEKATNFVGNNFDFTADGLTVKKSQVPAQYAQQARIWASRRSVGTHDLLMYPRVTMRAWWLYDLNANQRPWIANLAEQDFPS